MQLVMMMMIRLLLSSSVLWLVTATATSGKINERRILLPYNSGVPTNFTLETSGDQDACLRWSSSRPDIATVRQLVRDDADPGCSRAATVTVVSTLPKRQSTVITAHDLKTNVQIRCDVEIDVIKRIMISTTTKEIVFGELPETIKALAFDAKNDLFTSIGGVPFDWSLTPSDVIRYRPFSGSPYAAPDFVEYWESRGAKSSMILVEGVKTGSARIRASVLGDAYRTVEPVEIDIHVVANLLLIPSNDVFLVPGATVHFRAEISKQGPRVPLVFPHPQYYLEVMDPDVAVFDEATNLLEAVREGHTILVLKDRNIVPELNGAEPVLSSRTSTDIHVMPPGYISMTIRPGESFQLCNDFEYDLELSLYDDNHHHLYPSENFLFNLELDEEFIEVLESTKNKTHYRIRTKKIGSTKLIARFYGAGNFQLDSPLTHHQDAVIYSAITLIPDTIVLPWIDRRPEPVTYTVEMTATGATGAGYDWRSANESLAVVRYDSRKSSRARIITKGLPGQVAVTCTDLHNSLIFNAVAMVKMLPIGAVEVLPSIVEAPVGGQILLPIAVSAVLASKEDETYYFDDCSQVRFEVDIVEKNRIRYQPDTMAPGLGRHSCRSLSFECIGPGNSRVIIYFQSKTENKNISTHAIIGCFKPLTLVHPDEHAILALGASIDLAFEGGPRPWSMYPEGHYTKMTPADGSLVEFKEIKDRYRYNKDLHIFRAHCSRYGETKIDLEVGNLVSATLPNPASTTATVRLVCARPETLIIKPRTKAGCPQQESQFSVEKNQNLELDVVVLDQHGSTFYNFSTLHFEWSKDGNGMFQQVDSVAEEVNAARGFSVLRRSYQILSDLTTAKTRIRCRIHGYHQHRKFRDQFDVQREIELVLADPLTTDAPDNRLTVLKLPVHRKVVTISNGSGYFSIDWIGKQTVRIEMVKDERRKFVVSPIQTGNGAITITDQCLDYPPHTVSYSVVEPIDVKVQMVDKIQLGSHAEGTFYVLDNRGMKLHSSLHSLLDFAISSSNNYLTIGEIKPKGNHISSFSVKAERLGLCKLMVESRQSQMLGRTIRSAPLDIQIFSPLQIWPANITLIVGNVFQPSFLGGPQAQRNVEFTIDDGTVATTVNPNGLIEARKIGHTRLVARVTSAADNYEYSRAYADLYVVSLTRIKIWAPVNQLLKGAAAPLYVVGRSAEHEVPFMFGHAEPALKITWSVSNQEIGELESSFQTFGITGQVIDPVTTRFVAKSVGLVTVKVTVEVTRAATDVNLEQLYRNQLLTDTIQLQVYPDYMLSVASPTDPNNRLGRKIAGQALLMSPQSELILYQNPLDYVHHSIWNASQVRLVNQTGNLILQAGDQLESSMLMVRRDLYRTGVWQFFSHAVHVDKVRYFTLEFDPVRYQGSRTNWPTFPIGSEIHLVAQYYDLMGRKFDAVKSNLKWMLSRQDIITVMSGTDASTQSLRIHSLKTGQVILMLWDDVNQVKQFYKIIVGVVIEPPTSLDHSAMVVQVGDVVCLRSKSSSPSEHDARWSSVDQSPAAASPVGWIHPHRGVFVALNPGKAIILYNHSSSISTYQHVHVLPLTKLKLNVADSSSMLITGVTVGQPQYIPVWTGNHKPMAVHCPAELKFGHDMPLPLTCDVTFGDGTLAAPTPADTLWDVELQYHGHQWTCALLTRPNLDLEALALWDLNVTVTVMATTLISGDSSYHINDDDGDDQLTYGLFHQVVVPFLPPFQTTLKQVILTLDARETKFTVNSAPMVLEEMVIKSSNEDVLSVRKIFSPEEEVGGKNSMRVMVALKNADIFSNDVSNLHLILASKLTNQTEKIPVQIKLYGLHLGQLQRQLLYPGTTDHWFYNTTMFLVTATIGFAIYWTIKRLGNGQKIVFVDSNSDNNSVFASRSPRVVDYISSRTPTSLTASPVSSNTAFRKSSPSPLSSLTSPASPVSVGATPSTGAKLGRPLYSTRTLFS